MKKCCASRKMQVVVKTQLPVFRSSTVFLQPLNVKRTSHLYTSDTWIICVFKAVFFFNTECSIELVAHIYYVLFGHCFSSCHLWKYVLEKKKKHGFSALPVMARFCPEAVFSGHMMFL